MQSDLNKELLKPISQSFLFTTKQEWQSDIDNWNHKIRKIDTKLNHLKSLV